MRGLFVKSAPTGRLYSYFDLIVARSLLRFL